MKFPHITEIDASVADARATLAKLDQRLQRLKDEQARVREHLSKARQQDAQETARERLLSDPDSAFQPGELVNLHNRHEELEREQRLVEDATAAQRQRVKDAERAAGTRLAADHRDTYRELIQRLSRSAVETALLAAEEQRFREDLTAAGGRPGALGVANSERFAKRLRHQSPLWHFLHAAIEAGHLSRKDCIALDKLIDAAGESPSTIGPRSQPAPGALVRYLDRQSKHDQAA